MVSQESSSPWHRDHSNFSQGSSLKGYRLAIHGQWLFVALACHGKHEREYSAPALGLST